MKHKKLSGAYPRPSLVPDFHLSSLAGYQVEFDDEIHTVLRLDSYHITLQSDETGEIIRYTLFEFAELFLQGYFSSYDDDCDYVDESSEVYPF